MGKWINYKGYRFGRLTVISDRFRKNNQTYYLCQCDCGNIKEIRIGHLKSGKIQSCGCLQKEKMREIRGIDLTNKKFGFLTALSINEQVTKNHKHGDLFWNCQCDCGNTIVVASGDLRSGHTKSCGCNKSKGELIISQILNKMNIKFQQQKSFSNLYGNKGLLKFDFYLLDYNICIEYQGIQHYKDVSFFKETLEERQERDNKKREYCKEHDIPLIEISYWDYDKISEEYIKERLDEYCN